MSRSTINDLSLSTAAQLPNQRTQQPLAWTAPLVAVGALYFALVIALLPLVRPDLDPMRHPASQYAVGPYGIFMASAFLAMTIASTALVIGLARGIAPAARSRAGLIFLGLWGAGVLVAMIFPMDALGAPLSVPGAIHNIAGPLTFLSMAIAMLLLSLKFNRAEQWRSFYRPSLLLSLLFAVGFIWTFLSFVSQSGLLGVAQRFALAMVVLWMVLAAMRLRTNL